MVRKPAFTRLRRLADDRQGATLPEFAIVLPTFLLLLLGIFDIGHGIYAQAVLQGALQDAGRDAGLESGMAQQSVIDEYVHDQMEPLIFEGQYTIERKNYQSFSDVGRPEEFIDSNNNDTYDADECFTDENGNGNWDADVGESGLGGANDVVLYTVTVDYERVFPLWKLIGGSPIGSVSASTVMRNQPFGTQGARATQMICPEPS